MTVASHEEAPFTALRGDNEPQEVSLLDLLLVLAENFRMLIVVPLMAGLVALGISFLLQPTFTGTTTFMPPQQQQSSALAMLQSLGSLGGLAGAATGIKNPNDQFIALLRSNVVEDALVERFDLVARYDAELKTDARRSLENASRISVAKDGLITVEVDDHDPELSARLANAYVEELGKLLNRLALTEAQQRRVFFEKQLLQTRDKLTQAEQALKASGVSSSTLKSNPEVAVTAVVQLQAQVTAQEIKLASMRGYLSESAPDFVQARTELSALRSQLAKVGQSTSTPAGTDADYIGRYRDFKYFETLLELFAKQFELAKVDEAREGAVIQVVDVAMPPERKSKPKKAVIAIVTTLATGVILLLYAFARHAYLNAQHDPVANEKIIRLQATLRRKLGRT